MDTRTPVAPAAASPDSVRLRLGVYAALVLGLGAWSCFGGIGRGMLVGDEASFAYTTERMRETGDYVVPYIDGQGRPHLNAAPLYNWLSCLTADACGEGLVRYRLWAATFGVGCGLAAFALGAVLFGPEVGLVAGCLLLTNHAFLFLHGARWSVMESGVAFFATLMLVGYARTVGERPRQWWAFTGACLGLAVLMKPPAMGGFLFLTLCGHHLAVRRDLPWKQRLAGPLLAGLVAGVVALPWYAAITIRVGPEALDSLFVSNAVRRAADPGGSHAEPPTHYVYWLWHSSDGFKWAARGTVWGLLCLAAGCHRRAWGLLVIPAGLFLIVLSSAATKHFYYSFTVYPTLAVVAAGMLFAGVVQPVTSRRAGVRWAWRVAAVAGVVATVGAVSADFRRVSAELRRPVRPYPPLVLYRAAESELASGRAKLLLYRFPDDRDVPDARLGLTPGDAFYLRQMPHAVRVPTVSDLNRELAAGLPTIVVLPPHLTPEQLREAGCSHVPDRVAVLQSGMLKPPVLYPFPVLLYHGAESGLGLADTLKGVEGPRVTGRAGSVAIKSAVPEVG